MMRRCAIGVVIAVMAAGSVAVGQGQGRAVKAWETRDQAVRAIRAARSRHLTNTAW
jgi:hypothetical protein